MSDLFPLPAKGAREDVVTFYDDLHASDSSEDFSSSDEEYDPEEEAHHLSGWTTALNEEVVAQLGKNYVPFIADAPPGVTAKVLNDDVASELASSEREALALRRAAQQKAQEECDITSALEEMLARSRQLMQGGDNNAPRTETPQTKGMKGNPLSGRRGRHLSISPRKHPGVSPQNSPSSGKLVLQSRDPEDAIKLSRKRFLEAVVEDAEKGLSSKLCEGVPGRGMHREVRDTVAKLKNEKMEEVYLRGAEHVFGNEPSFWEELLQQGRGAVLRQHRRKFVEQLPKIAVPKPLPDPTLVFQKKVEADKKEIEIRRLKWEIKKRANTMTGANLAYCAKTFLTWIALSRRSRIFASAIARQWDPFDVEIREKAIFHPPPNDERKEAMRKAGILIKTCLFRHFVKIRLRKKRIAMKLLVRWLRVLNREMKLKFAVHHYLSRVRRMQRSWRNWQAARAVRAIVWAKQYMKEEQKLIQMLTLERELEAASKVEGSLGGGLRTSLRASVKNAPPSPSKSDSSGDALARNESAALSTSHATTNLNVSSQSRGGSVTFTPQGGQRGKDEQRLRGLLAEHNAVADLLPALRSISSIIIPSEFDHILLKMNEKYREMHETCRQMYEKYDDWVKRKKQQEYERERWKEENKELLKRLQTGKKEVDAAYIEAARLETPLPPPPQRPYLPRYLRRRVLVEMFLAVQQERKMSASPGGKDGFQDGDEAMDSEEAAKAALSAAVRSEAKSALRRMQSRRGVSSGQAMLHRRQTMRDANMSSAFRRSGSIAFDADSDVGSPPSRKATMRSKPSTPSSRQSTDLGGAGVVYIDGAVSKCSNVDACPSLGP